MVFKDLKSKSLPELEKLIEEFKAELFLLRFKNSTGQQDKTHKIKLVRRDIAKVLTAIKQIKMAEATSSKESK
ncbi:50S ribosomal protein L29 [Candidatus Mycoplasma pogonae]